MDSFGAGSNICNLAVVEPCCGSLDSSQVLWLMVRRLVFLGLVGFGCNNFGFDGKTVLLVPFVFKGAFLVGGRIGS